MSTEDRYSNCRQSKRCIRLGTESCEYRDRITLAETGDPVGLAVSGNTLFVSSYNSGTVGEYNAATGAVINASFLTGLNFPEGLALTGNHLFVTRRRDSSAGIVACSELGGNESHQ